MKKTNTTLAIMFMMFAVAFSAYAGAERMQLKKIKNAIQLRYTNASEGTVKITIKDESGTPIHREEVASEEGFKKSYDFSDKTEGFYTFEIADNEGDLSKEIGFFKPASILTMVKPNHNKYRLLYGIKRKSKIQVLLYNDLGDLVFEDVFMAENGFEKTYWVSKYNTDATRMKVV
ncbi:MAG: hypothetical protein AAFO69_17475, partial [Bacteroidota bacterium]